MSIYRRIGALVALMALVAGCAGAPSTPPASSSPTPAATIVPSTPSPMPSVDVVARFRDAMADISSGVMAFEGTVTIGPVRVTMSGTSTFDGPDSRGSVTTTVGGESTTTETTTVTGARYSKSAGGPWLPAAPSTSSDLMEELLKKGSTLEDRGTSTRDGVTVHELVADASTFDPAALLGSVEGLSSVKGEVRFYVTDDGVPVGAEIDLSWRQAGTSGSVEATLAYEIAFRDLGDPQTIRAPEDVWAPWASERWGFSLARPADFDYTKDKSYEYFISPGPTFMTASRGRREGFTLNQIAKVEAAGFKTLLKAKSTTNEGATLAGQPARLISATGTNSNLGGRVVVYEAITVKGDFAYYIVWVAPPGNEVQDLATFRQVLATFAIK